MTRARLKNEPETLDETLKDQIRLLNCTLMRSGGSQVLRNRPQDIWCVTVTTAHCGNMCVCVRKWKFLFISQGWLGHIAKFRSASPLIITARTDTHTHTHQHGVDKQTNEWPLHSEGRKAMRRRVKRTHWGGGWKGKLQLWHGGRTENSKKIQGKKEGRKQGKGANGAY